MSLGLVYCISSIALINIILRESFKEHMALNLDIEE